MQPVVDISIYDLEVYNKYGINIRSCLKRGSEESVSVFVCVCVCVSVCE